MQSKPCTCLGFRPWSLFCCRFSLNRRLFLNGSICAWRTALLFSFLTMEIGTFLPLLAFSCAPVNAHRRVLKGALLHLSASAFDIGVAGRTVFPVRGGGTPLRWSPTAWTIRSASTIRIGTTTCLLNRASPASRFALALSGVWLSTRGQYSPREHLPFSAH